MFSVKKQINRILTVSALSSFQIAGASWVVLLAARGFSLVEIGVAESVFHMASFLFEIPSGVISDVFGRKKSMVLSQCMFILSAFFMMFSQSMAGVCFALILDAFGYNFASGAREALAYDSLKSAGQEEEYLKFSSTEMILYRLGNASAILCAGLALMIGYRKAYAVDMVLGLICLVVACRLKEVEIEEKQLEGTISARIVICVKESFYFLTHNFRALGLMFWNAFLGAVSILTVFFLQARLPMAGLTDLWLGPALFVLSLGGAVGARLVLKMEKWNYIFLSLLCAAGALAGLFTSFSNLPVIMTAGGFLTNLCDDLLQVHTDAKLNDQFPSSQRATLVSVSSLCFSMVMIVLSPVMGWIFGLG